MRSSCFDSMRLTLASREARTDCAAYRRGGETRGLLLLGAVLASMASCSPVVKVPCALVPGAAPAATAAFSAFFEVEVPTLAFFFFSGDFSAPEAALSTSLVSAPPPLPWLSAESSWFLLVEVFF